MTNYDFLLLLALLTVASVARPGAAKNNQYVDFSSCDASQNVATYSVDGAQVTAIHEVFEPAKHHNCTVTFQTPLTGFTFLIHIASLNLRKNGSSCVDTLTIRSPEAKGLILDRFCGSLSDLPADLWKLHTQDKLLSFTYTIGPNPILPRKAFKVILTAYSQMPVPCDAHTHLRCSNNDCISTDLRCDKVKHCWGGEDEDDCPGPTTPSKVHHSSYHPIHDQHTTKQQDQVLVVGDRQVYLWLPLIVVLVFTFIMVALILIGRKAGGNRQQDEELTSAYALNDQYTETTTTSVKNQGDWLERNSDTFLMVLVGVTVVVLLCVCIGYGCREQRNERNEGNLEPIAFMPSDGNDSSNRLTINTNQGYAESEGPRSPPPIYESIFRQTSVLSNVSQRSSDLCVPPDYEEALNLTLAGERASRAPASGPGRARVTRSSTGSGRRRRQQQENNRLRLFSRSLSQPTGRSVSPRNSSADAVPPQTSPQAATDDDVVFMEGVAPLSPGNTTLSSTPRPRGSSSNANGTDPRDIQMTLLGTLVESPNSPEGSLNPLPDTSLSPINNSDANLMS